MKHVFLSALALLLALTLSFAFAGNLNAAIISIDFEELDVGDAVYDQYNSDGVIFSDGSFSSPGKVASQGYNSDNAIQADLIVPGIYMIFTIPVYSVSTFVLEGPTPEYDSQPGDEPVEEPDYGDHPEPEEPEEKPEYEEPVNDGGTADEGSNTVYLYAYEYVDDTYNLLNDDDTFVHAEGSWEELSFSSEVPIAAVQFVGTQDQDFWLDNIVISTETEPVAEPVPEPATMLLLGVGLTGLACFRNRFKKK